jgi:hypothetical protein
MQLARELGFKVEKVKMDIFSRMVPAFMATRVQKIGERELELEYTFDPATEQWTFSAGPEGRTNKVQFTADKGEKSLMAYLKRRTPLSKLDLEYT